MAATYPAHRQMGFLMKFWLRSVWFIPLSVILFGAIFAPHLTPYGPTQMADFLQPPSLQHWFGTDDLGRDVLTRVLYGARTSLGVATSSMVLAGLFGVPLGLLAGYWGGWIDSAIMRCMDTLLSLPAILLALVLIAILGPAAFNAAIAIAIIYLPFFARLARASTLSLRELEFVEAARSAGATHTYIIFRIILPNCISPILVQASLGMSYAILVEAGLSFLGLGVQPPTPSWGLMLLDGRNLMPIAPWCVIFPGIAIFITSMSLNFLGDALQTMLNPLFRGPGKP